jgi:cyclohexadienyl dehydratase
MRVKQTAMMAIALCLTGIVGLVAPAHAQTKSHLQRVLESGTLRVGTTGDYNPMTIFDPQTKEYRGFEIDAAHALAADLGVKVEFVPTDWKTLVAGLVADKYDILMSGTSVSIPRAKVVAFTIPYNSYFMIGIVQKKDRDRFKSWADVDKPEVQVAVTLGTNFETIAKAELPHATLKRVEAPARDYQEVLAGRAQIGLTSSTEAAALIKTYPDLAVVLANQQFGRQIHAYMVQQSDTVWTGFLDSWIALKQAEGFYDKARAKWLALE